MKWRIAAKAHFAVALACLVFLFARGVTSLTADPIRTADYNSWKHIGIGQGAPVWSIAQTLESVAVRSSDHAPLYFVLLNVWAQIAGKDLATMRLLSLFFAMLALAFAFRLALSTGGTGAALDAVVLTTSLAYFLYYSLEVRMYSLLLLLTAWVAFAYWRATLSPGKARARHWLSLVAASAAIINVHYFGFLVLAAISLHHLLFAPKDKPWLKVPAALLTAGLFFLPWLPVALDSLTRRSIPDQDVLRLLEAIPAILSPYSNGLALPWLLVGALFLVRFKRLRAAQRYMLTLALTLLALILLANEFADLIIARRLRYTIVLMPIWNCALALALNALPHWQRLRIPALLLWIIAGWLYSDSSAILLYTNRLADGQIHVPPIQRLYYEPDIDVRPRDFLVSVHADTPLQAKQFDFYAGKQPLAFALIHMWINDAGELETQFNDTRYPDLQSIAGWRYPIWLVFNPAQTDFERMDVYADVVVPNFQRCRRYVERADAIVDLYLADDILCELFIDERPLAVNYEGGNQLENIAAHATADALNLSFLWANIVGGEYAFSVQIFDQSGSTGVQIDDVIDGWPVHIHKLDLSPLPAGEYAAKLIVYSFESGESQSGVVVESGERIERELEIARFVIDE